MFSFLSKEVRAQKAKEKLEKYLLQFVDDAKKKELDIDMDQKNILAMEISRLSEEIISVKKTMGKHRWDLSGYDTNTFQPTVSELKQEIADIRKILEKGWQS